MKTPEDHTAKENQNHQKEIQLAHQERFQQVILITFTLKKYQRIIQSEKLFMNLSIYFPFPFFQVALTVGVETIVAIMQRKSTADSTYEFSKTAWGPISSIT